MSIILKTDQLMVSCQAEIVAQSRGQRGKQAAGGLARGIVAGARQKGREGLAQGA
jgi:hypothetical protein